jgi:hypothetical protein
MDGVGIMFEVTATQLIIVNITMEEAEHKAKILALMNIAFPFHKSDKNYPIDFIINPPYWLRGIMLPLCVRTKQQRLFLHRRAWI